MKKILSILMLLSLLLTFASCTFDFTSLPSINVNPKDDESDDPTGPVIPDDPLTEDEQQLQDLVDAFNACIEASNPTKALVITETSYGTYNYSLKNQETYYVMETNEGKVLKLEYSYESFKPITFTNNVLVVPEDKNVETGTKYDTSITNEYSLISNKYGMSREAIKNGRFTVGSDLTTMTINFEATKIGVVLGKTPEQVYRRGSLKMIYDNTTKQITAMSWSFAFVNTYEENLSDLITIDTMYYYTPQTFEYNK